MQRRYPKGVVFSSMSTNRGGFWELIPLAEWKLGNNGASCAALSAVASNTKLVKLILMMVWFFIQCIISKESLEFHSVKYETSDLIIYAILQMKVIKSSFEDDCFMCLML